MNVQTPLKADAQLTKTGKPGVRALNYPAMPSEPLALFYASTGDACSDCALLQIASAAGKVVALVRMQCARAFARRTAQARHGWEGIEGALERHRIMPVGTRDCDRQGNASGIYDQMPFAPEFAPVRRVGAGFLAPRGLATLAASRLARSQSIWSCSRNRQSMARCSLLHTPAACQSRNRRQHVMPLPKPSSCGKSSHGTPVCRTYRIPFNAARSSTVRRRPPLGEGVNAGINGSSTAHNSLLILRLAMTLEYAPYGLTSRLR